VVLGVGNLLRRDDGIGVRVVQELAATHHFPVGATLVDAGTAGLRLLPLLDQADHLIVVDAVDVGVTPGTVLVFGAQVTEAEVMPRMYPHETGPLELLALLEATGNSRPQTTIIGVQPADLSPWDDTLSEPVARAMPEAIGQVVSELQRLGVLASKYSIEKRGKTIVSPPATDC
jgi:hydrogenase maturation protease